MCFKQSPRFMIDLYPYISALEFSSLRKAVLVLLVYFRWQEQHLKYTYTVYTYFYIVQPFSAHLLNFPLICECTKTIQQIIINTMHTQNIQTCTCTPTYLPTLAHAHKHTSGCTHHKRTSHHIGIYITMHGHRSQPH